MSSEGSERANTGGPSSAPHRRPDDSEDHRIQRAPQACFRCRRKKLRCTGGCPCHKCIRAEEKCEFKKRSGDPQEQTTGLEPSIRIAQLERTVATLLSDLSSVKTSSEQGISFPRLPNPGLDGINQQFFDDSAILNLPPPSTDPVLFQPQSSFNHNIGPSSFNIAPTIAPRAVHFGPSPTDSQSGAPTTDKHKDKASPQNRLAVASQIGEGYSAPFQALTYQPGLWENREQSRRGSPQPGGPSRDEGWPVFESKAGPRDDPISTGIIDEIQATTLFTFFFTKCHHFLPIVATTDTGLTGLRDIRQRCTYLCTTILAIGARFYLKHCARHNILASLPLQVPAAIARLAYSHLAASLFRKQHQLADVQATLLLAGWGLQSGGGGPDPWLVTGHCTRLAQRLGLHRLNGRQVAMDQAAKQMLQTRTWLGWYHFDGFLSLGFGRPQSQGYEGISEQGFLQLCIAESGRPEMRLDLYIASMVQLTKIGRDLISWIQVLTDWSTGDSQAPLIKDGQDLSIGTMLRELNKRLDEWTTLWTWNGSLSAIQLGASGRLAKLQSEHVRLCLNSLALKPGLTDTMSMTSYIQKATEAAINTVQAHADSVKEDMYLSYSVDYITIALGQAAVFLIRLHSTSTTIPIDRAVIAHYLQTAIELLEDTDLSETKNSTYVGRVCRDLSGVAGIPIPSRITEESPTQLQFWNDAGLPLIDTTTDLDLESFLQFDDSGIDLNMLFGLPTDALNMRDLGSMVG